MGMPPFFRPARSLFIRWRRARATTTVTGLLDQGTHARVLAVWIAILLLLEGGLVLALWHGIRSQATVKKVLYESQRELQPSTSEASNAKTAANFAGLLPRQIEANSVLVRLQRSAAENGVALVSVYPSKEMRDEDTAGLRRFAWDAQLSGSYPGVKAMLTELLDESSELWLSRLYLRSGVNGVEAQITLQAWSLNKSSSAARDKVTR